MFSALRVCEPGNGWSQAAGEGGGGPGTEGVLPAEGPIHVSPEPRLRMRMPAEPRPAHPALVPQTQTPTPVHKVTSPVPECPLPGPESGKMGPPSITVFHGGRGVVNHRKQPRPRPCKAGPSAPVGPPLCFLFQVTTPFSSRL